MPHPDGLPDLFLDRSLGRIAVPSLLRAAGLRLVTLAERYGLGPDEGVVDEVWLRDASANGEAVFLKDVRVRYNVAEKAAITRSGARCFCIPRGDLTGSEMAERYLSNLDRIVEACSDPGPFVYSIQLGRLVRLL